MSGLDFTARLIGSLAWPLVILVLILVLHAQIKKAAEAIVKRIADITEVTVPGGSVKLEKQINDLAKQTEALPEAVPRDDNLEHAVSASELEDLLGHTDAFRVRVRPTPMYYDRLQTVSAPPASADVGLQMTRYQRLAAENPKAAVLSAFSDLEVLLRRLYEQNLGAQGRVVSFGKIIDGLERAGRVDENVSRALREVSDIRNTVAHSDAAVNQAMADGYIESIGNLIGYMISLDVRREDERDTSQPADDGEAAAPSTDKP